MHVAFYGKKHLAELKRRSEDPPDQQVKFKKSKYRSNGSLVTPVVVSRAPTLRELSERKKGRDDLLSEVVSAGYKELSHIAFSALKFPPKAKQLARLRGQAKPVLKGILDRYSEHIVSH